MFGVIAPVKGYEVFRNFLLSEEEGCIGDMSNILSTLIKGEWTAPFLIYSILSASPKSQFMSSSNVQNCMKSAVTSGNINDRSISRFGLS